METPLFLENERYKLFGVLHEPDLNKRNGFEGPLLGFVFCHPFAEEKLIAHRVMVNLARKLTQHGVYCLRFDYMGHGDSDGNFEDATIDTRLSDIRCAIEWLRTRTATVRVGLLGIRLGATLAALSCVNNPNIEFLILVSPIVEGKPYVDGCLRSNLTAQMALHKKIVADRRALVSDLMSGHPVNIDGYMLTKVLYEQIQVVNLLNDPFPLAQHILLLDISKDGKGLVGDRTKKLFIRYKTSGKKVELFNVSENLFWIDTKVYNSQACNTQERILDWLLGVSSLRKAEQI